jgi:DNA repair photolyase
MRMGAMRMIRSQLGLDLPGASRPLPTLDERRRGTSFHGLRVSRILNSPETTRMPFWSINPYVGCEFGCAYCYARETHRWTAERTGLPAAAAPREEFERRIFVKQDIGTVLQRTLDPARIGGGEIVIGTATDPYQPAERRFGITRALLEAFAAFPHLRISITTKSPLVARDADLLVALGQRHEVSVCLSIISYRADLIRRLEPKTPLPHARLRGLKVLTDRGVDAGLLIAPIVPGLTDGWNALGALLAAGREAGARFASGSPLRLGPVARAGFLPILEREFPELAARYRRRYAGRHSAGADYGAALQKRLRALRRIHGYPEEGRHRSPAEREAGPSAGQQHLFLIS